MGSLACLVSPATGCAIQHGQIRTYAAWILIGVVVFTSLLLWMVTDVQQTFILTVLTFLPVAAHSRCCCCAATTTCGFAAWR